MYLRTYCNDYVVAMLSFINKNNAKGSKKIEHIKTLLVNSIGLPLKYCKQNAEKDSFLL